MRSPPNETSRRAGGDGALLIGVAGGSGSGKSTLAAELRAALGPDRCVLLSFDRYYKNLAHLSPSARAAVNFDHPDSLDDVLFGDHLDRLRGGDAVDVPVYDFATHSRSSRPERVESRPVVVAEGILLLAVPHLADRLDLTVFVDTPEEVRLARRVARDTVERGRSEMSVRAQYAATVGPMHRRFVDPSAVSAHLRVPGTEPFGPWVEDLVGRLAEIVEKGHLHL